MPTMYKLCLNLFDTVKGGLCLHRSILLCRPTHFAKSTCVRYYIRAWKCMDSNRELLFPPITLREGTGKQRPRPRPSTRPTSSYNYLSDDIDSDETLVIKDYSSFLEERDHRRKLCRKNLQDTINCTEKELDSIFKKYPDLLLITSESLSERVKNFADIRLTKEVLKDNPWLLGCEASTISFQIQLIQKMGLQDINESVILLSIPLNRLREISSLAEKEAHIVPGGSRIKYLCKVLKCQQSKVCKAVAEHIFLQRLSFQQIKTVLDLLLEYGVSPEDIMNDVWVFRYNPLTVEDRLKKARDADIKRIKPWIVRCPVAVLSNTLRRRVESLNALGPHSSVLEYLSQRLECSLENVITLSHRYPPLLKVQVTKVKEVLDFIYSEGFSPQQVYQVPRILCHSLETTQERLNQIRDLRHNPTSLIVLCKSKRDYVNYLNRLKSQQKHAFPS